MKPHLFNLVLPLILLCVALPSHAEIPNFVRVNQNLFRGGRPDEQGIKFLKKAGVRTIINLQGGDLRNTKIQKLIVRLEPGELPQNIEKEKAEAQQNGLSYLNFPLDSIGEVSNSDAKSISQVLQILTTKEYFPIFIHCEHGQDRTGLILALYRVMNDHYSIRQAHEEWESLGHDELHQLFTGRLDIFFYEKAWQLKILNFLKFQN